MKHARKLWKSSTCMAALLLVLLTGCAAPVQPVAKPDEVTCCAVVELRQYATEPGTRDVLIDLFEKEFIEGQETLGIRLVGQFRDVGNPERFVWLRGFTDMPARGEALVAFYSGPVWKAHRAAANPTIADAANVLLLRPIAADTAFKLSAHTRHPIGTVQAPGSRILATIYYLKSPVDADFVRFYEQQIKPFMTQAGATQVAAFQTETAANNFPKLPIRSGENVLVGFARFASEKTMNEFAAHLENSARWRQEVLPKLQGYLTAPPEQLRLQPTPRSLLH
ncbi:MAG: NIPSNAP family protein [Betaproteobacteria bacterium]